MQILGQFSSADLAEDAQDQPNDIVIIAVEVYSDAVGRHH